MSSYTVVTVHTVNCGPIKIAVGSTLTIDDPQVVAELVLADKVRLVNAGDGARLAGEVDALDRAAA